MRKTIFKRLEAQGLIVNYNRLRKNRPRRLPKRVFIWDETIWEGEQIPSVYLTYVERVKLAKMLDEIGVSIITVGYPAMSDEEKNSVRRITNETFEQASLAAPAYIEKNEVDACLDAGIREIGIFTPFNELNLQHKLKMSKDEVLKKTVETIEYAKSHDVTVDFVLEDATRTPIQDILQIFEASVKAGADRLVIADTVGFLRPLSTRYLLTHIRKGLNDLGINVPLSIHCHNDFGLATANTLTAIEEGITYPHTCVAGFGGRAGIAPFEEVVTALEILYDVNTGINVKKLYRLSQLVEKIFALPIQFHKPIVGENAFSFEWNKHAHGIPTHSMLHNPFPPEMIGRENILYLGRNTDRQTIEALLTFAGIKATPMQINEIFRRVSQKVVDKGEAQMTFYQIKKLMKDLRRGLSERDFWNVVEEVTRQKPKIPVQT